MYFTKTYKNFYNRNVLFSLAYWVVVKPVFALKILQKWYRLLNPHSSEIAVIVNGVSVSNCFALLIRIFRIYCFGVVLYCDKNNFLKYTSLILACFVKIALDKSGLKMFSSIYLVAG